MRITCVLIKSRSEILLGLKLWMLLQCGIGPQGLFIINTFIIIRAYNRKKEIFIKYLVEWLLCVIYVFLFCCTGLYAHSWCLVPPEGDAYSSTWEALFNATRGQQWYVKWLCKNVDTYWLLADWLACFVSTKFFFSNMFDIP